MEHEDIRLFHQIIIELCNELGIEYSFLSYNWIIRLKKNNIVRYIAGNRWDLNSEATGNIMCDKFATYEILHNAGIPVIEHKMIFDSVSRYKYLEPNGNWGMIIDYFHHNNQKIVVKPNHGSEGMGVYLCENLRDLEKAVTILMRTNSSISICPFYAIKEEYRVFYLNGEVLLIYKKSRPFVTGDGENDLQQLILLAGYDEIKVDTPDIDFNYVPDNGEIIHLTWKHNLFYGAKPQILPFGTLYNQISILANSAAQEMNIHFATIDIIENDQNDLRILEINSGVCMTIFAQTNESNLSIAKTIYKKALSAFMTE